MDVDDFLRELGLQQYEAAFRDNRIDIRVLPKLTAEDLKDIGIATVGDRRLLLEAIAALRESAASNRSDDRGGSKSAVPPVISRDLIILDTLHVGNDHQTQNWALPSCSPI